MSTTLRLTKFVNSPRGLIPAVGVEGQYCGRNEHGMLVVRFTPPFKTAIGTTALPDERYDYVEIYLHDDEVEIVSTDEDFVLTPRSAAEIALDSLSDVQRFIIAYAINTHGDGRIGTASEDNLREFPFDYMRDCFRALADEARLKGQTFHTAEEAMEILAAAQSEQTSSPSP